MARKKRKTTPPGDRKPLPADFHVGKRIRMRRALLGISQEELAKLVGLTFQQIQKYERGLSRVSAGRLHQFSKILQAPVNYFYDEFVEQKIVRGKPAPKYIFSDTDQDIFIEEDLIYRRETIDLIRAYYQVEDEKKRRELLGIFRSMIESVIGKSR